MTTDRLTELTELLQWMQHYGVLRIKIEDVELERANDFAATIAENNAESSTADAVRSETSVPSYASSYDDPDLWPGGVDPVKSEREHTLSAYPRETNAGERDDV